LVRARKFREDLYFRLNVVTLDLPPLRARRSNVVLLAEHFLTLLGRARRMPPKFTAAAASDWSHTWPATSAGCGT
jgi:Nif-specific regulatory protein